VTGSVFQTNDKKERSEMYEKPKLNLVGDAQDVILGCISSGDDLDGCWFPGGQEYADDGDDSGASQSL
jgi:hypothetical protein